MQTASWEFLFLSMNWVCLEIGYSRTVGYELHQILGLQCVFLCTVAVYLAEIPEAPVGSSSGRFWKTVVLVDPIFSPWTLPSYASFLDERYIFPWYPWYIILYSQSIPIMVLFNMLSNQLNYSIYLYRQYICIYTHDTWVVAICSFLSQFFLGNSASGGSVRHTQFWVCRGVSPCFGHGFFRCVLVDLVVWDMYMMYMWLVMMNSSNSYFSRAVFVALLLYLSIEQLNTIP